MISSNLWDLQKLSHFFLYNHQRSCGWAFTHESFILLKAELVDNHKLYRQAHGVIQERNFIFYIIVLRGVCTN